MTRFARHSARAMAVTIGVAGAGTTAVLLPPKEKLPAPLLSSRVLLEGVGRVGRCAYVGGQIYSDYFFSLRGAEKQESQDAWDEVHARCAHRLVSLAETNGGLYVKAGQIFANMTHILPPQYCRIMAVLQDAVVKRPYSEIVAVLESDLNMPVSEVFEELNPVPIAAASLAQVHRGRLRKDATDVAVKVQYIDIAQRFNGDMRTIDLMLRIAGSLYNGFDFGEIVRKLNETVAAELDFRIEAHNCIRAAKELKAGGFGDRVVCTTILSSYTTKRVLLSVFVKDAVKISDRAGIQRLGLNVSEVATNFFDALSYQIFRSGFFHGDPHAGNVLVHKLPNGKPQVVLLDYGLCGELSKEKKREISDIWTSSVTHDSETLKGIAKRYNCDDYELFASTFLQHPYVYFRSESSLMSDVNVQESIRDTVKHKMNEVNDIVSSLPKEYALILRSIMAGKAINAELGHAANRPLCMLRYSLKTSHEDLPRWQAWWLIMKAWANEKYSRLVIKVAQWRDPELVEAVASALQVDA